MAAMDSEAKGLKRDGLWFTGPRDFLSVLGRSRWETYHSAVISWLLTPMAPHGFGTRVLVGLLEHAFPGEHFDPERLEVATGECEVRRSRSIADIVVTAPGLTLVIETKVDADEQSQQCYRQYLDYVDEEGARFVFLTPTGRPPVTATGDASVAFSRVSFRSLRDILRSALAETSSKWPSAAGRPAAETYLQTLEVEFP